MRLYELLEVIPRTTSVHIESYNEEVLFRGKAIDALKSMEDGKVFTLFSLSDCEYGNVLYISLEEDSND